MQCWATGQHARAQRHKCSLQRRDCAVVALIIADHNQRQSSVYRCPLTGNRHLGVDNLVVGVQVLQCDLLEAITPACNTQHEIDPCGRGTTAQWQAERPQAVRQSSKSRVLCSDANTLPAQTSTSEASPYPFCLPLRRRLPAPLTLAMLLLASCTVSWSASLLLPITTWAA